MHVTGEIDLIKKEELISLISKIRRDIGHKNVEVEICNLFFDEEENSLLIITPDRPEKSVIIGKGGWVVGRLREELGINSIHVEAYSDFIVPKYRMKLALVKLEEIITGYDQGEKEPLVKLSNFLKARIKNPYHIDSLLRRFKELYPEPDEDRVESLQGSYESNISEVNSFKVGCSEVNISKSANLDVRNNEVGTSKVTLDMNQASADFNAVVALSGGVDSSASLIIAKMLGFNPLAVTVNPGDIILPRYFRESVENLTRKLGVEHRYLDLDMQEIIDGSLEGRFHPCGKCSNAIEETILQFARENKISFLIYGDLLSTGAQSIHLEENSNDSNDNSNNLSVNVLRINLPAMLCLKKGDLKNIAGKMGILKKGGYGCPLIGEVHRKHPHMRRFSIQRVLRETRAGALEPGEALSQINSVL